jgi:hypothetical protein
MVIANVILEEQKRLQYVLSYYNLIISDHLEDGNKNIYLRRIKEIAENLNKLQPYVELARREK